MPRRNESAAKSGRSGREAPDVTGRSLFESMVEHALDAVIAIDGAARVIAWNRQAEALFGWARAEALGRDLGELIIPHGERQAQRSGMERYFETGQGPLLDRRVELRGLHRDGGEIPVALSVTPIVMEGQVVFQAFIRDLRQRQSADELKRQRDEMVGAVLNSLTSGVAVIDREGTITAVNQAWRKFASENNADPNKVSVGVNYVEVADAARGAAAEDAKKAADGIRAVMAGDLDSLTLEYPCHSPDRRRWFLMTVSPLRTRDGGAVITHLDITRRREVEQQLRSSEERFRGTFERATVGIGHVSSEGCWLRVNPKLCAILGYGEEELVGRQMLDVSHSEDRIAELKQFELLTAGGVDSYSMEKRYLPRSEEPLWVNVTAGAQRDPDGELEYIVVIVEDISERAATAAELRSAAEEAKRIKADFLANVSHELRTPMNAIIGMTQLALRADLSPTVRDYLETVDESASVLLHLVNDILDFSKIEAGRFELERTAFHVREVLEETTKPFALRAAEKGLKFELDVSREVPPWLVGDPLRLRQIVANLLSNAVKFTERGEVSVRVAVETEESEAVALQFTVADTGVGVSPEVQARIFEPFTQADTSTTRLFGGSGLGLAICSELTSMMGGRLWIESEAGKGSRFHFDARFLRAERKVSKGARRAERSEPASLPPLARSLKVLVAEDIPANRKVVREILVQRGHTVVVARNGQEAVDLVAGEPFDVVLMDVQMPVLDGFAATRAIRSLEDRGRAGLPIVALTAHAMRGDAAKCLNAGMDAYLPKPLDLDRLITLVESLADPERRREVVADLPAEERDAAAAAAESDVVVDFDRALARLGGNRRLLADMITFFQEDAPELLGEIHAGVAASDAAQVRRASHSLKGLASNFDARVAVAAAEDLQELASRGQLSSADAAIRRLERAIAELNERLEKFSSA